MRRPWHHDDCTLAKKRKPFNDEPGWLLIQSMRSATAAPMLTHTSLQHPSSVSDVHFSGLRAFTVHLPGNKSVSQIMSSSWLLAPRTNQTKRSSPESKHRRLSNKKHGHKSPHKRWQDKSANTHAHRRQRAQGSSYGPTNSNACRQTLSKPETTTRLTLKVRFVTALTR